VSLASIYQLLLTADSATHFPPTILYNEGWLTRLVLSCFHKSRLQGHALSFAEGATWYSEAQLPTPFRARRRGDRRAEARTHADGLFGHLDVGLHGKTDVALRPDAGQFVAVEAKILAPLSGGTKNDPEFGQAARYLACMAEILSRAGRPPGKLQSLAFFVLAPESQIQRGLFSDHLSKDSIRRSVSKRASQFGGDLDNWLHNWFEPCLEAVVIGALSWEEVIHTIGSTDSDAQAFLGDFYRRSLEFNALPKRLRPGRSNVTPSARPHPRSSCPPVWNMA